MSSLQSAPAKCQVLTLTCAKTLCSTRSKKPATRWVSTFAVPESTEDLVLADLRITGPKAGPIVISVFGDADDPRRGINLLQSAAGLGKISGMENARTITVNGSTAEIADKGNGILQIHWTHSGTEYLLGSTGFSEDEVVSSANSLVRAAE